MGTNTGRSDAPHQEQTFLITLVIENPDYTSKKQQLKFRTTSAKTAILYLLKILSRFSK